jgi:hypothetical protein
MEIPNTFTLYGQTWRVRAGTEKELPDLLGMCYPDTCEILLNPNQTADSLLHSFVHEVIHAIEIKQHLELTEHAVDLLALGLRHLIIQNPELNFIFGVATPGAADAQA